MLGGCAMKRIICFLGAVSFPLAIHAAVLNVPSASYPTIQACANNAQPGDTCLVNAGTYSQRVAVNRDGTSGNPITFLADGAATVCGFDFSNASHVRVIGFTIDSNAGTCAMNNACVTINGTNEYLEFWNNTFRDGNFNGIRGGVDDRLHNSLVIGNRFQNFGIGNGSGMAVGARGNNNLYSHNEISNSHPDGFMIMGTNNRWTNNYTHGFSEASGGHSDIFQTGSNVLGWNYNLIEGHLQIASGNTGDEHTTQISHGQASTYCPGGCGAMTENIFRGNVWHNVSQGTIGINQSYDGPITHTRYYNNTTAEACENSPNTRYGLAWYHQGTNHGYIFNNIEYESWGNSATSSLEVYCLSRDTSCNPANFTYRMDYNLAYDPDGSVTFSAPWTSQANPRTNVNPQFVDYANDNFSLGSGSPAIGAGGPLTTVTNSGSGTTFTVADSGFFRGDNPLLNQYNGALVTGDWITVGTDVVQIASISGNSITVTAPFSWAANEPVYFGNDATPDIGAIPYLPGETSFGISIVSHTDGQTVSGAQTFTANVTNAPAVRHVIFFVDGIPVSVDNTSPYTMVWDSSGEVQGSSHLVEARAYSLFASKTLVQAHGVTVYAGVPTPAAPSIVNHPQNLSVAVGQTASFSVSITGYPLPSFQWQRFSGAAWTNVGTNSRSYTIPAATLADNNSRFRCIVTNDQGSATSGEATLVVTLAAAPTPTPGPNPTPTPPPNSASAEFGFLSFPTSFVPARAPLTINYQGNGANLTVYDRAGNEVRLLDRGNGTQTVWDGKNNQGSFVASGTYVIVLKQGNNLVKRKVVLVK